MKSMRMYVESVSLVPVLLLSILSFATLAPPAALAQAAPPNDNNNPPPFDFNDGFYTANGVDFQKLIDQGQRFGIFGSKVNRLTGPPAGPNQVNWVIDNSNTDPDRKSVRILASTGGYKDDTGSPTQFISIIAFLNDQSFFTADNQDPAGAGNARGVRMQDIAGNFEAYAGLKQIGPSGVFLPGPCANIPGGIPGGVPGKDCFSVASVETPHLRQDWRFSTNRSAIDGSAQFSYNGDNLVGLWIITYHWYTAAGFGPKQTPECKSALNFIASRNGLSLDGTPIIKTGAELHFVEGALQGNEGVDFPTAPNTPCANEGNLDPGGADRGPVWLVCPSIPEPTQGGIAPDAFVDTVRKQDGSPLDPQIAASFNCLQKTGQFCPLANGTYSVKNQTTGLFWDDTGTANATQVQLFELNGADQATKQQWTFTVNPDGTYTITNRFNGLALASSSIASGTQLVQVSLNGGTEQKWIVAPLNNGYRITNLSSKLAVDATSVTPAQGTSIVEATPTGDSQQVWVIR